jgi:hypothetical protein
MGPEFVEVLFEVKQELSDEPVPVDWLARCFEQ